MPAAAVIQAQIGVVAHVEAVVGFCREKHCTFSGEHLIERPWALSKTLFALHCVVQYSESLF